MRGTYVDVDIVEGRGQDHVGGEGGADEEELYVGPERVPPRAGLDPCVVQVRRGPRQGTCRRADLTFDRILVAAIDDASLHHVLI